jgi:hypothetical protein
MKLLGSRALGSSSARKYLRTWDSCFQKLSVSCACIRHLPIVKACWYWVYLKLLMTVEQQHIYCFELIHVSMPLEFLPHFRPKRRHGHVQRVHGLDFGSLYNQRQPGSQVPLYCCPSPHLARTSPVPALPCIRPVPRSRIASERLLNFGCQRTDRSQSR